MFIDFIWRIIIIPNIKFNWSQFLVLIIQCDIEQETQLKAIRLKSMTFLFCSNLFVLCSNNLPISCFLCKLLCQKKCGHRVWFQKLLMLLSVLCPINQLKILFVRKNWCHLLINTKKFKPCKKQKINTFSSSM